MDNAMDAFVKVEKGRVKVEKEGGDYIEINGTRYKNEDATRAREQSPEYVEVDGKRYKKVKLDDDDATKVKKEVVLLKEVDGVIEID
jgi:hypothetical protein